MFGLEPLISNYSEHSIEALKSAHNTLSEIQSSASYLPSLTSNQEDIPVDYYRRLIYLSKISPAYIKQSPFTQKQEEAIKKSIQAARNTQICLRCGWTTFLFFSCLSGSTACLALTSLSRTAQAIIGCGANGASSCILAELGLQYGGRNTDNSSDMNNAKQNIVAELVNEYTLLGKFLIRVSLSNVDELKEFSATVARGINVDSLREKALSYGTPQDDVEKIFKFFHGSVSYVSGTRMSNFEVNDYVKFHKNSL